MSQSWSPRGSWGDWSPVSLNWTPKCPEAEAPAGPEETRFHQPELNPTIPQNWNPRGFWGDQILSTWVEPHHVPKLKPHVFCSDLSPVSLNWTPQCPKAEPPSGPEETRFYQPELNPQCPKTETPVGSEEARLPSNWAEPHHVPKLKPHGSCQPELNLTLSWSLNGSWGDQSPVSGHPQPLEVPQQSGEFRLG